MTAEEAKAVLQPVVPRFEYSLEPVGDEGPIMVDAFLMVSGDYASDYLLAFADGKLLFWGYPHEFARSRDPLVNQIGDRAVTELDALAAEQKRLDEERLQQQQQQMQR